MILLFDIGNTHTHVGLADERRVRKQINLPTREWFRANATARVKKFIGVQKISGAILCSVVPRATPRVKKFIRAFLKLNLVELNSKTVCGIGIDYPNPKTIGPDRLANAVAAKFHFGAPVIVVDFGTAVTFDVVNSKGNYIGGIIAPGLAAMTDYLHEKTALLPKIKIREPKNTVGKSTEKAMLIGAVYGYRGLIRGLLAELKRELKTKNLPLIATGGYAKLIASKLPEISAVRPDLTLEGLRLVQSLKSKAQSHFGTREFGL
jgi:type III pantothenate kinase